MQYLYNENTLVDLFCLLRLGFLGLLHMEVFNQRLEQEYNASVIVTAPTVPYKAVLASAKLIKVEIMIGWDNFTVSCILCMFTYTAWPKVCV